MDKKKLYIIFTIIIVALLPSAVFASVVISSSYSVSTAQAANPIIMIDGPNYNAANGLHFITLTNGTTSSGRTITFGYVGNGAHVELVDVLEIKNNSSVKAPTYIDLSLSSTTNISVYYSSTPVTTTFPSISDLGTPVSTSASTLIIGSNTTSTASVWYISVYITGTVTSDTATMSYDIQ